MAEWHDLMGGNLHVYKRGNGRIWQCSIYLLGKEWQQSTKQDSLALAREFAEDWYLELRGKDRAGLLSTGRLFKVAAEQFTKEYEIITEGQRAPKWVEGHKARLRLHLLPFFGNMTLPMSRPARSREYRMAWTAQPWISVVMTGYLIAFVLARFGANGVLTLIAGAMVVVAVAIGGWGPATHAMPTERQEKDQNP